MIELQIRVIPEWDQRDGKKFAVVDLDEPGIPWEVCATREEAERFIESFNVDRDALESIKPRVEDFVNRLAAEIYQHPYYVADHVARFAQDMYWPTPPRN